MLDHNYLCERAARWLYSNQKCDPVLTRVGSTSEIPDAIGWASKGSILIECKTNRSDFLNDKKKYVVLTHSDHEWTYSGKSRWASKLKKEGWVEKSTTSMGDYRFFMCEPGIIEVDDIQKRYPDHGLLHVVGRRVKILLQAPPRKEIDFRSELRYLRFALVHVRDNLSKLGCSVDLAELTKYFGTKGITFPEKST